VENKVGKTRVVEVKGRRGRKETRRKNGEAEKKKDNGSKKSSGEIGDLG